MKYVFKMDIYTDGDFTFPFVPRGMDYDDGCTYTFEKSYNNQERAIEDIKEICAFMKEQIHTSREYVKECWNRCIDEFIEELKETGDSACSCMGGNYDGTQLSFYMEEEWLRCGFFVNDDELEMMYQSKNIVTDEMIKEAVLNLYRKD